MAYAVAQKAFEKGWEDVCILVLLGFDRFARTGELFAATKQDFVFNHGSTKAVWSLPLTKSGQRLGAQESLVIEDVWLVKALRNFLAPLKPGDTLRRTSPGIMRSRLKQLLSDLHFPDGFQWWVEHVMKPCTWCLGALVGLGAKLTKMKAVIASFASRIRGRLQSSIVAMFAFALRVQKSPLQLGPSSVQSAAAALPPWLA
eukprot:s3144_g9.t1